MKDLEEALQLHFACYNKNFEAGSILTEKSDEYARNTGFFLFNFLIRNGRTDDFFRIARELIESEDNKLDPLEEPLTQAAQMIKQGRGSRADLNRLRGRSAYLGKALSNTQKWYDSFSCQRIANLYKSAADALANQFVLQK
jgi:hypothetical protein